MRPTLWLAHCTKLTSPRHVFKGEGFNNPIDERHCVNGISLNFKEEGKK